MSDTEPQLIDLALSMARMEGKLDTLIDSYEKRLKDQESDIEAHGERITSLERRANIALGGLMTFSVIVSVFSYLTGALHTLFGKS